METGWLRSKSQFLSGFWVEVQSTTRWENEIECSFFFFFSFIFLKKFCYSNINWWERTKRSCKRRRQVWNAEKQTNKKKTATRLTTSHKITWPSGRWAQARQQGEHADRNKSKMRSLWQAKWGFKPKRQCLCSCVCVCVCVWGRGGRKEGGVKRRELREQAGKQVYIRELEGFQETARS